MHMTQKMCQNFRQKLSPAKMYASILFVNTLFSARMYNCTFRRMEAVIDDKMHSNVIFPSILTQNEGLRDYNRFLLQINCS
jgi:hypothetical protein